jgi:hypothetical protein
MRTGNEEATVDESTDSPVAHAEGAPAAASSPARPLRPGDQLASVGCTARVVVVRAPSGARPLITCGGSPMIPATGSPRPPAPRPSSAEAEPATLIGKRYVDADETLEVLCVSSGTGVLSCDGVPMTVKAAKPLPASD